jgi:hypothetical protein
LGRVRAQGLVKVILGYRNKVMHVARIQTIREEVWCQDAG